jgi:hypothetical protein
MYVVLVVKQTGLAALPDGMSSKKIQVFSRLFFSLCIAEKKTNGTFLLHGLELHCLWSMFFLLRWDCISELRCEVYGIILFAGCMLHWQLIRDVNVIIL